MPECRPFRNTSAEAARGTQVVRAHVAATIVFCTPLLLAAKMVEGYFRFLCPRCGEMHATSQPLQPRAAASAAAHKVIVPHSSKTSNNSAIQPSATPNLYRFNSATNALKIWFGTAHVLFRQADPIAGKYALRCTPLPPLCNAFFRQGSSHDHNSAASCMSQRLR
jgi:hypothetical protein